MCLYRFFHFWAPSQMPEMDTDRPTQPTHTHETTESEERETSNCPNWFRVSFLVNWVRETRTRRTWQLARLLELVQNEVRETRTRRTWQAYWYRGPLERRSQRGLRDGLDPRRRAVCDLREGDLLLSNGCPVHFRFLTQKRSSRTSIAKLSSWRSPTYTGK